MSIKITLLLSSLLGLSAMAQVCDPCEETTPKGTLQKLESELPDSLKFKQSLLPLDETSLTALLEKKVKLSSDFYLKNPSNSWNAPGRVPEKFGSQADYKVAIRDKNKLLEISMTDKTYVKQEDAETYASFRAYQLNFPLQNEQETYMTINDPGERMTQIHFFPKVYRPRFEVEGERVYMVLSTGEKVAFDKKTGTLVGGALKEQKKGKELFGSLKYEGNGLIIKASRKGGSPRNSMTTVIYKGLECKVHGNQIWSVAPDKKGNNTSLFKFKTSEDFYQFIEKKCDLNLHALRNMEARLRSER